MTQFLTADGRRQRWIVIGEAERCFVRIRNWGVPNGFRMYWRGKVDWCQPFEFDSWTWVRSAIKVRLEMAGLRLVGETEPRDSGRWEVKCLVQRIKL